MYVIVYKDTSIHQTASATEELAWDRLHNLNYIFANKTTEELQKLGYAAKQTRTKERVKCKKKKSNN